MARKPTKKQQQEAERKARLKAGGQSSETRRASIKGSGTQESPSSIPRQTPEPETLSGKSRNVKTFLPF